MDCQPSRSERGRGRPGYGSRKAMTLRVPEADLPELQKAAEEAGHVSVPAFITSVLYEHVGMVAPKWVAPSGPVAG